MKTEEFVIKGGAEPIRARVQWVIITLNKGEGQGQKDQKALIADIVKAVRKEDEKQKQASKPKPKANPKKVKYVRPPPAIVMPPSPMPPYMAPVIPPEYMQSYNLLHNYVRQGFWTISAPPTIVNRY